MQKKVFIFKVLEKKAIQVYINQLDIRYIVCVALKRFWCLLVGQQSGDTFLTHPHHLTRFHEQ